MTGKASSNGGNRNYAGYDQLYLGATPGTFVAPWIRDLTTSKLGANNEAGREVGINPHTYGVFRTVPMQPPTVPDSKLFRISVALSYMGSQREVQPQMGRTSRTDRWLG